ncbi:hypothetical protein LY76DRAFT_259056 [Colletotrichum caudatum]|nr:hypothetical protein LY76DRAFT_259056 [Colletotrichum caudatum]
MIGLPGVCLAWNCHGTAVGWSPGRSLAWHRLGEPYLVKGVVCTTEPPFSRLHIREAHKLFNTPRSPLGVHHTRALTTQPTHRNPSALSVVSLPFSPPSDPRTFAWGSFASSKPVQYVRNHRRLRKTLKHRRDAAVSSW